ncbi:MAG: glycosyltransferase family 1 protein, partial [Chloroflexota bacterium]
LSLIYNPALPDRRHNLPELVQRYPQRLKLVETGVRTISLDEQWRLFGLVRQHHFNLWHTPYYIRPYLLPCPSVLTVYDVTGSLIAGALPSRKARLLFEMTTRLALLSSPHLISISDATRTDIIRLYKARSDKIKVIPLGVDEEFRPFSEDEKIQARLRLKLPPNYLLYVGINKPHKNLERLLEAFKIFRERTGSSVVLILAGREDPRYAPALHEKAQRLGLDEQAVRFWGEVNEKELPALYGCADLFLFPSLYEGFGLPVLEAMASGTPVICADNSSLPEVAGEATLLFPAEDVAALVALLEKAVPNPTLRAELAQKGLAQAHHFSWQYTAQQTLEVYREILNAKL